MELRPWERRETSPTIGNNGTVEVRDGEMRLIIIETADTIILQASRKRIEQTISFGDVIKCGRQHISVYRWSGKRSRR
jgi:hypothetical protein